MADRKQDTHFTIMLIPHSEKPSTCFKVPIYLFQALAVILILAVVLSINFVGNYFTMAEKASEVDELREVNRKQSEKIDQFAKETKDLKDKMSTLAETEQKVRAMLDLEDFKDEDNLLGDEDFLHYLSAEINTEGSNNLFGRSPFSASSTAERTENTIRMLSSELPDKQINLEDLKDAVIEKEEKRKHTPSAWPVRGRISSPYGDRRNPFTGRHEFHEGVDIAADHGTPIQAPAKGTVVYKGFRGGYGNLIIIDHGYDFTTYYAHLSRFNVERGEPVEKGDVIGYVGTSGNSTGPHLHYEVHVNHSPVDPKDYMP